MKYRQTVARTVSFPKGWIKPKLSDCLHMKSGDMITAKRIFEVEAYPVYGGNGLRGFTNYFNREGAHSLIGRQGALCGAVHFADGRFYASEHAIVAKAVGKNDQRFLTYALDALNLNEVSEASAQPGLSVEKLRSIEILCPTSPEEQQAIAAALSDADGVVAGLERVIAKKRLIKQGTMQDLLTARRRLPGFSGEWEVKKLGSLGICLRGVSYDGSADLFETETPESIALLRANNVQSGEVIYSDVQHVRTERVKPVQYLKRGDVLVCMANGSRALVGKAGVFSGEDGARYTFGAFMGCFRHAEGTAADGFVPFLFQSDEYRRQLNVILSGSAINNLAPSQISGFTFKVPVDHSEQKAIADVLSDMDAEIQTLEARLTKARAVKEGMMQNLLTGRVRLV